MKKIHTKLVAVVLIFSILAFSAPSAHADTWGANMMSTIFQITTEKIQKQIYETLLANLRIMAIRIVQGRLMTLLTGRPGGAGMGTNGLIISDWRQFIYGSAQKYSTQITNNFFQNVSSGAPSGIMQNVISPAQRAVNTDYWGMKPDMQYYVSEGKAANIFNTGATSNPWMAWRMAAMPQNDLAFMFLRAESFKQESYRSEEEKKKAEGVAGQGYKGVEKSSGSSASTGSSIISSAASSAQNITTPGSTVKDLSSKVLGMNLDTVSLSQSIPDIVSNLVVSMLTRFLNQGIASITSQVDQKILQIRGQTGLPAVQLQRFIQSGVTNSSQLPPSSLPSGWNRGGQD